MSTPLQHTPLQHVPTKEDILAAAERIAPFIERTPALDPKPFNQRAGRHCIFKGEHLQQIGAFKARGAMNAVLVNRDRALQNGLTTHSSGNHGAALAWAASQIGATAHIVMPSNAPKAKVEAVKFYGGNVHFCEPNLQARESTAEEVIAHTGSMLIHPYDNYDIIAGQATATLELLQDHPDLDFIFVPVGGGGLLSGASLANKYFGNAQIIGCEPANASDAYQSFKSKKWRPVTDPNTIADGLRTSLGTRNFPIILENVSEVVLVTEEEIETAWRECLMYTKQFIEPSAAVGIAAMKNWPTSGKSGIILCGGNMNVDQFTLR